MTYLNKKYHFYNDPNFWNKAPFLKFLIPFIAGILSANTIHSDILSPNFSWVILVAVPSLLITLAIVYFYNKYNGLLIISLFILFFSLGSLVKIQSIYSYSKQNKKLNQSISHYHLEVDKILSQNKSTRFIGNVLAIKTNNEWEEINMPVLCYADTSIEPGTKIYVKGYPKEIKGPKNPKELDFKRFYGIKGIHYQDFLNKHNFLISESHNEQRILQVIEHERWKLHAILEKILPAESAGIASAMLLGIKNSLHPDIKKDYSEIGVMHVLAVSGLHVGILYLFINLILGWMKKYRYGRIFFLIVSCLIIWTYATLTGLSNSVIRASLMFTIFLIGENSFRRHFHLNSASLAALIILVTNPDAIFDVSFQLSFGAIYAILLFYKPIYGLMTIKNSFLNKVWQMTAVSVAAQLGTVPITIFYFHQFAPGFLIGNLLAIPMAGLILVAGLVLILTIKLGILIFISLYHPVFPDRRCQFCFS